MSARGRDLSYTIRVQDRDLKKVAPILRAVNRQLRETNTAGVKAGRGGGGAFDTIARKAKHAEREVGRVARGVVAASGAFRSFGRSIAFGSLAFLGGASLTAFLKSIITDARDAESSQRRLDRQFLASGVSIRKYGREVERTVQQQSKLAAVEDELVRDSMTVLIRATGDVTNAQKLNALALDVSRARHIDLLKAADLVGKVYRGNYGTLARYGIIISKSATPLEALMELQRRFSGQAITAGSTSEGAATRFGIAWRNVKEEIGLGVLPYLTRGFDNLSGKIADPKFLAGAKRFGETVGRHVLGSGRAIARFVRENRAELATMFRAATLAATITAGVLSTILQLLGMLGKVTPGGGSSLLGLIMSGYALKKVLGLVGGLKVADRIAKSLAISTAAAAAGGAAGRIPTRDLREVELAGGRIATTTKLIRMRALAAGLAFGGWPGLLILSLPILTKLAHRAGELVAMAQGLRVVADPKHGSEHASRVLAVARQIQEMRKRGMGGQDILDDLQARFGGSQAGKELIGSAFAAANNPAIMRKTEAAWKRAAAKAKGYFDGIGKDMKIPPSEAQAKAAAARWRKALEAARRVMDDAFSRVQDKALSAFDAHTSALEERLRAVVKLGDTRFTITATGKTPAERELDALDRLDARKRASFDLAARREELAAAQRFGDPRMIREAQQNLGQAERDARRPALEARAALERAAADRSLERARKEFEARRALMREHFSDELAAIQKRLDAGKLKERQARALIVKTLKRYGVDLRTAGHDLGSAFSVGLVESLGQLSKATRSADRYLSNLVSPAKVRRANALAKALERIAKATGGPAASSPTVTGRVRGDGSDAPRDGVIRFSRPPGGPRKGGVKGVSYTIDRTGGGTRSLAMARGGGDMSGAIAAWLGLFGDAFVPQNTAGNAARYFDPRHNRPLPSLAATMPAALKRRLGGDGTKRLLQRLAQAEAHPTYRGGHAVPKAFSIAAGGDTYLITVDARGNTSGRKVAQDIRAELQAHGKRNARQTRGPRKGVGVGLG